MNLDLEHVVEKLLTQAGLVAGLGYCPKTTAEKHHGSAVSSLMKYCDFQEWLVYCCSQGITVLFLASPWVAHVSDSI